MKNRCLERLKGDAGKLTFLYTMAVLTLVWSFPPVAKAQDAVLEEVIVTAQKRAQSLQEVPISVFVMDGETISDHNFVSMYDLANNLPAVTVIQGGPSDVISIRGVFSGNNGGFEQSVGTFVDDIFHGRSRYSRSAFMDIERVEILRGPQSIFFGNSAIAGALNITTRKPGETFEGYVSSLYEPDHGEYNLESAFGGPIADTLSGRIAVRKYGMTNGFVETLGTATDEDGPQSDDIYGRATLAWSPAENFDATLKVELGKSDVSVSRPNQLIECPPDPAIYPVSGGFWT